jgi:hypothetical protein
MTTSYLPLFEIENFLKAIRPKTYFLRSLRGYNPRRSSSEATRIVKSLEVCQSDLKVIKNSESGLDLLRTFDKNENQTFVSALFELLNAFDRINERNSLKTKKNVFSDILLEIYEACSDKFELSWSKERERVKSLFDSFLKYAEERELDLGYRFEVSFEFFYFSRLSKSRSLSRAKESERATYFNELSFFRNAYKEGVENVLESRKADYLEFLTANLLNALAKHLPEDIDRVKNIFVRNSAKGYAVEIDIFSGEVSCGRIITRSIPVEGPEVRFHYRYITHVDKFRSSEDLLPVE